MHAAQTQIHHHVQGVENNGEEGSEQLENWFQDRNRINHIGHKVKLLLQAFHWWQTGEEGHGNGPQQTNSDCSCHAK
jgi:hypothetical protein